MVANVYESYVVKTASLNLWTDSTVVLSWLHGPPRKWKPYVGNRTSQIFLYVPNAVWRHIKSEDNPADLPSRGIPSKSLMNNMLWWEGPDWLKGSENYWPKPIKVMDTHEEERHNVLGFVTTVNVHCVQVLLDKFSEWTRIIHIMARIKRFIYSMKNPKSGWINTEELQLAEIFIVKEIQRNEFSDDITHLHRYKMAKSNSRLISLAPFIDENGLLRVGGRLENVTCSYDQRHPIILPRQHKISKLILRHLHIKYLHPGPTHLTSISRTKYSILGVREESRSICNKCIKSFKYATNKSSQLMGNLPSQRLVPAKPFNSTGVDYAGPIMLATKRGRGAKLVKGYIVIFIYLVTKALHIEVASDLTSESFLAVLKRFTARRLLNSEACKQEVITYAVNIGIKWSFIPPAAPNFGGIWERAVRSVKTHLVKVIGNSHLTFEEMSTVLAQIENVLNSRPLCAVTNEDTDNIDTLTPAHFLILGTAAMVPDNDYSHTPKSYLTRWQHVYGCTFGACADEHHSY